MREKKRRKYFSVVIFSAFTLIFVLTTLLNFYDKIQKREYEMQLNALKDLSIKSNAIIENKLEGYLDTLHSVAGFLGDGELHTEENLSLLSDMTQHTGFDRIGLADLQGNSRISNGKTLNISNRGYFRECLKKKEVITESTESVVADAAIFIVSVPVLDSAEEVKGVLYGVIQTDSFQLYEQSGTEKESQYIHIIDRKGGFILRNPVSKSIIKTDNFLDGLEQVETQVPPKEIRNAILEGRSLLTEMKDGEDERIAYFYPLKINNWYIVTVLDKSDITDSVAYLLGNDVYMLTMKVIGVVILLCVLIMYHFLKERQKLIERKEVKFRETLLSNTVGFMEIDLDEDRIVHASDKLVSAKKENLPFSGYMKKAAEMKVAPEYRGYVEDHLSGTMLRQAFEKGIQDVIIEFQCCGTDGNNFWVECECHLEMDRETGHLMSYNVMRNINEKKHKELSLQKQADIDQLTGLYNRRGATDKINQLLQEPRKEKKGVLVCMIVDLDNFKLLNDTLGHQMGDKALEDVAEILKRHFRTYDVICRLGGDEFLIFVSDIPHNAINRNVGSLLEKLHLEYKGGSSTVRISASAGIALAPEQGTELKELYHKADMALYEAKQRGKSGYQIYEDVK